MIDDYMKIWEQDAILQRLMLSVGNTCSMSSVDYDAPIFHKHLKKWDLGAILSTIVIDPFTQILSVISLYRSFSRSMFNDEERQLKQALMPHFVETWGNNRLTHMLSLSETGQRVSYSSAAVDRRGVLHASDNQFSKSVREEWSEWRGPSVPEELAKHLSDNSGKAFIGRSVVIRANAFKDLTVLRIRKKATYDKLSVRERQISQLFANGQSQKDIAKKLSISPATVNNHITTVYAKLGINDKAQLGYQVAQFE